jgi:hypothetical protein
MCYERRYLEKLGANLKAFLKSVGFLKFSPRKEVLGRTAEDAG